MRDIKASFIELYFNELVLLPMFQAMRYTIENSPWHQESNVLVHTNMVVANYLRFAGAPDPLWILGAFAAAFHDVGKPPAEEHRIKDDGTSYRSYHGHEIMSARVWMDFACINRDMLARDFRIGAHEIWAIAWLIENHLPYKYKKDNRRKMIVHTNARVFNYGVACTESVFTEMIMADQLGRICETGDEKIRAANEWNEDLFAECYAADISVNKGDDAPRLAMMIGPSSCGKSTFARENLGDYNVFSMDVIRHEMYGDDYFEAFQKSQDNKSEFSGACQREFMSYIRKGKNLVVDNTNLSRKRRNQYIHEAARQGYILEAYVFMTSLDDNTTMGLSRTDRLMSSRLIKEMYGKVSMPSYGEFDFIHPILVQL